jgi:hypothetical protein
MRIERCARLMTWLAVIDGPMGDASSDSDDDDGRDMTACAPSELEWDTARLDADAILRRT